MIKFISFRPLLHLRVTPNRLFVTPLLLSEFTENQYFFARFSAAKTCPGAAKPPFRLVSGRSGRFFAFVSAREGRVLLTFNTCNITHLVCYTIFLQYIYPLEKKKN